MVYIDLEEDAEYFGEWFLAGSDEKIPGTLHHSNGRLKLFLLRPILGAMRPDAIHGECARLSRSGSMQERMPMRETVTLLGARSVDGSMYSVYAAVFGGLPDGNHKLDGISFSFDILHEWAVPKNSYQNDGDVDFRSLEKPERLEFADGKAKCALIISHRIRIDVYEGRHDSHMSAFTVEAKDGMSLQDLLGHYVRGMHSFLMIATGRNMNLKCINRTDGRGLPILVPTSKKPATFEQAHLVELEDVHGDFADIMGEWMKFYASNKYIVDSFADTIETPRVEETDFFVYASLVEGYSKYKYGRDGDYKERIRKALKRFEADFGNMRQFIDNMHEMRNNLFHANQRESVDTDMRGRITHDLYFLIRIILLNETGLDLTVGSHGRQIRFLFLECKSSTRSEAVKNPALIRS